MMEGDKAKDPRLTDVNYWDQRPERHAAQLRRSHPLERYLKNLLPVNPTWTCLEVGVVPGKLLLWMAKRFGYRVTGVDLSEKVHRLETVFREHGLNGEFVHTDFLDWEPKRQFDVVLSAGFVEHFRNYEEVIGKHWELVRPGGFLIMTLPAWSPVQRLLRRVMYKKHHYETIVASHHTAMMNLATLNQAVGRCTGGSVKIARYIGEMRIWFRPKQKGVRTWMAPVMIPFRAMEFLCRVLRFSHCFFSPEILIIKQKDVPTSSGPAVRGPTVLAQQRFSKPPLARGPLASTVRVKTSSD